MKCGFIIIGLTTLITTARAQIVRYDCTSWPESEGWLHRETPCPGDRWLQGGWLYQHAEPDAPHCQKSDSYRRSLEEFSGTGRFFAEWFMETDGPRTEIVEVAPAYFVASGQRGIHYHFTIARDQVRFMHRFEVPPLYVDIQPDTPHVYRLEVYGEYWFEWMIDGKVYSAGVPPKTYPTADSFIVWGNLSAQEPNTTRWDWIEYGIPEEPSVECDRIRKLKAFCRNSKIKAKVKSSLDEGTELTVTNAGDHRTMRIKPSGKGKVKYKKQAGEHTILLLDCPAVSEVVDCG